MIDGQKLITLPFAYACREKKQWQCPLILFYSSRPCLEKWIHWNLSIRDILETAKTCPNNEIITAPQKFVKIHIHILESSSSAKHVTALRETQNHLMLLQNPGGAFQILICVWGDQVSVTQFLFLVEFNMKCSLRDTGMNCYVHLQHSFTTCKYVKQ